MSCTESGKGGLDGVGSAWRGSGEQPAGLTRWEWEIHGYLCKYYSCDAALWGQRNMENICATVVLTDSSRTCWCVRASPLQEHALKVMELVLVL